MTPLDRDDIVHELQSTMGFYGKAVESAQLKYWLRAFDGFQPAEIKTALVQYTQTGKYAPKPVDILGVLDENRQRRSSQVPIEEDLTEPCPPEIAKAWLWFIGAITDGSKNMSGVFHKGHDIDADTQERYLHIVNHEARRTNEPGAIPDDYKLKEVWG